MVAPLIATGARVALGTGSRAAVARGAVAAEERNTVQTETTSLLRNQTSQTQEVRADSSNRPKRRVTTPVAALMLLIALITDGAQFLLVFIPVIGQIASMFIAFVAVCLFGIWFLLLDVSYFSGRKAGLKLAALFGTPIIELTPFLNSLIPTIAVGVAATIIASWAEDRETGVGKQARVAVRLARMRFRSIKL